MTKQYKPFDLAAAKAGAKLITRDGEPACFIAHVPGAKETHRVVTLHNDGEIFSTDETGSFFGDVDSATRDLFMAPVERTVYVNLYEGTALKITSNAAWHETPGSANLSIDPHRTVFAVAVPITITE